MPKRIYLSEKKMNSSRMIFGWECKWIVIRMWLRIIWIIIQEARSLKGFYFGIRKLVALKRRFLEDNPINKLVKVDHKYYWDLYQAGFPGPAFDQNIRWLLRRELSEENQVGKSIRFVMLAITKKCPLNCEHCYEWDQINKKDTLSLAELNIIVSKYQSLGTSHFFLGGGEPLSRYDDLLEILKKAKSTSEFWLSTSAYHLSAGKAHQLKKSGLTGVIISLDHFDASKHNHFRGNKKSFDFVISGISNAHDAGLVVALSVCTTREFITEANLKAYLELAMQLHVGFIQLVEPRAEGRYKGQDVMLREREYEILDKFYLQLRKDSNYKAYPKIIHPSYDQRNYGCAGAGSRFIMIDTDGYLNACPFCRSGKVHALDEDFRKGMLEINGKGCYKFEDRIF